MKLLKDSTYKELQDRLNSLESSNASLRKQIEVDRKKIVVNPGPSTVRDLPQFGWAGVEAGLRVLPAEFEFEVIPLIRKLSKVNPDMGQALNDFTRLANTGHKIQFDPSVGEKQVEEMRQFIRESSKHWHVGAAGMPGITNKMLRQVMIGGAISNEWVPNLSLTNLEEIRFINPENIRFVAGRDGRRNYQPYQVLKNKPLIANNRALKKLNPNQYKYFALNGDTDLPYGTPPYLPALEGVETQQQMIKNIRFIVSMLGVLGYLGATTQKPDQGEGEPDDVYESRLKKYLLDFKERVKEGFSEGVSVGYEGDHQFDFKQTAQQATGVKDLFEQNELLIASGLGYDAVFMGRPGATETLVTVLFTKVLAQLKNIQDIVSANLEFGYTLALTLGGFKFKGLSIKFNKSTITDHLKYQQALEIQIRNLEHLYDQGIIGQDEFADALDYIKPDQANPRITREKPEPGDPLKKQTTEKKKDASDRKVRDKNAPQGTIRKNNDTSEEEDEEDNTRIIAIK